MRVATKLKRMLPRFVSSGVKVRYLIARDTKELSALDETSCWLENLRSESDIYLKTIFEDREVESRWAESKMQINQFKIPDGSGGVNFGDRRAIYYLVSKLMPASVLEIGTHIGASTLHFASALYMSQVRNGLPVQLTTVDVADVNSTATKPWLNYGSQYSPLQLISQINSGSFVKFIVQTSVSFAANTTEKFDFIFLDGSQLASVVYQEIPMALKLLNKNGIILLHDYFPGLKPLWQDGTVIPGPYLAVQRFLKEGVGVSVLPLGNLPWPTKQGSTVTSLALLLKKDNS